MSRRSDSPSVTGEEPARARRTPSAAKIAALATLAVAVPFSVRPVDMHHLQNPPQQTAFTTTGPWNSLVHMAVTDSGVVMIDLGWSGSEAKFDEALESLGKTRADVTHVFVTHGHRDHVAGWPWVEHATFHMHRDEVPLFVGEELPSDWPSRWVERVKRTARPGRDRLAIHPFSRDTLFDVGEPLRAFPVPGHTPGSTAYLFRRVLFMGDAVSHMPIRRFHGAATMYSHDMDAARASLVSLFGSRLDLDEVDWVCTAHGKCSPPTSAFIEKVTR